MVWRKGKASSRDGGASWRSDDGGSDTEWYCVVEGEAGLETMNRERERERVGSRWGKRR